MAIAQGKSSADESFKRYIGVASCYVKAVNPTKKQMEELYGRDIEKDPEYITEKDGVKSVRIAFIVQPDPKKCGEEILLTHNYFLRNEYRYNKDKTKVQVIDKYGRTAWVTIDQAKKHEIPMYSNGPANLDKNYRPAYVGEEELTNFLIAYLCIPSPMNYNEEKKEWYMVENPQESECRLDDIANYFKGDFTEIKSAIALQPMNKVKILFTVRNSDDNKQYQSSYTKMVLRNKVTNYSKLDKNVQETINSSSNASSTVLKVVDFQEYKVEPTVFAEPANDDPFAPTGNSTIDELPFSL